ncbi:4-hydroxy-tetrahydrodipicolinate reductase [Bifidobacterium aemilianum]|uniref:4-hydroxy-tetrahydrodipicolinate reductase n=1 Tax=Bifidobacterium aemilianum TaxID=2493120 RepID=A0A366KAL2_9BIFI|nr:4-hydroxy-tetrahydrodipicolinate reductase [Bifidobacterium aemilianum]RBP98639.1 4-hydroxy-tetrahydrodipicolinate reductase [Bifidobacterium aemilianum]
MIRVAVVGAQGRMGSSVVEAVKAADDMVLSASVGSTGELSDIRTDSTDVAVEFTVPSASLGNVLTLIGQGVDLVVGTTGWTQEKLDQVRQALATAPRKDQAVCIAPNFAISAVLADYFASKAAEYFTSAEVIELHHPDKVDAPSGTAIHTAQAIGQARRRARLASMPDGTQGEAASRGQLIDGVPVHAVRLQGLNAHEEILLGNTGEQLTIRADSFDRSSFMPGVLLAVRTIAAGGHEGLTVGLDQFLDL